MRGHSSLIAAALAAAALGAVALPAAGAPKAARGGYDIGELMAAAEEAWDLSGLDAVVLVDSEEITLNQSGTRTTTVHRIVWMATELALETYADLRVPWNSATSGLDVKTLRTWRGGRWWPGESGVSETAVVETTPYAVRDADDYTTIRETMLLHDGVELPCVVETVYEVTERRPAGLGSDGLWVFSGQDPAVVSRFQLSVPAGTDIRFGTGNGAPEPSSFRTEDHGVGHAWEARLVDRHMMPPAPDPASCEPYVAWSTWADWKAMGEAIESSVRGGSALSEALRDSVVRLGENAPTRWSTTVAVADFIRETTRPVHYSDEYWSFSPRPASRTWETAYGHRTDRAVLAAALFREAGCSVSPAFRGRGPGAIDTSVPTLARFDGVLLWIEGEGLEACYDPETGDLARGRSSFRGRTSWITSERGDPRTGFADAGDGGTLRVALTLEAGEEGWSGDGFLGATGVLTPYAEITGLAGETEGHLSEVAGSVLSAGEISGIGVLVLEEDNVAAGFAIAAEMGEPDERGRIRLEIGDPAGGIAEALPADVHVSSATRGAPVRLPGALSETVTVRLHPGDLEVVRLPSDDLVENRTGRFALTVEEDQDGWIEVSRELEIESSTIPADRWHELRSLLLAASHERNRVILLE